MRFVPPPDAVMLPGAPCRISALAYGVALWATIGVLLPKALAAARTGERSRLAQGGEALAV